LATAWCRQCALGDPALLHRDRKRGQACRMPCAATTCSHQRAVERVPGTPRLPDRAAQDC